jgi:hypothetical protein
MIQIRLLGCLQVLKQYKAVHSSVVLARPRWRNRIYGVERPVLTRLERHNPSAAVGRQTVLLPFNFRYCDRLSRKLFVDRVSVVWHHAFDFWVTHISCGFVFLEYDKLLP